MHIPKERVLEPWVALNTALKGWQAVTVGRNVGIVSMEDLNDISEATKE